ncbi:hypothetical protein [Enterococcus faecalis]|uniref:hypothetical protein n=1 Tax=Enterococcus faecalis TaxID=1351 RepID=UPI002091A2EA|nr:hypothetical protein [Enterococcus faecalis]MCO5542038.1 hypothetical protein [Enterococcus faecalis]
MYKIVLKVPECLDILRRFGLNISEPAFRQYIRKGQVKNTYLTSKKEGVNIPLASLVNFMLTKLPGLHEAFELGKFYSEQKLLSEPLSAGGFGEFKSYIARTIFKNEFIYLVQTSCERTYTSYHLYIDYDSYTIHLYDDGEVGGVSAINSISSIEIIDIWQKLGIDATEEVIQKTCVNIYYCTGDHYSVVTGYGMSEQSGFSKPRYPLYEKFERLLTPRKEELR